VRERVSSIARIRAGGLNTSLFRPLALELPVFHQHGGQSACRDNATEDQSPIGLSCGVDYRIYEFLEGEDETQNEKQESN